MDYDRSYRHNTSIIDYSRDMTGETTRVFNKIHIITLMHFVCNIERFIKEQEGFDEHQKEEKKQHFS